MRMTHAVRKSTHTACVCVCVVLEGQQYANVRVHAIQLSRPILSFLKRQSHIKEKCLEGSSVSVSSVSCSATLFLFLRNPYSSKAPNYSQRAFVFPLSEATNVFAADMASELSFYVKLRLGTSEVRAGTNGGPHSSGHFEGHR